MNVPVIMVVVTTSALILMVATIVNVALGTTSMIHTLV